MPDTLTMQQVADLAGVRRAVVSMWRSRYPTTEGGFPAPVDVRSLTFSADAVGEWLTRTGRGNNPDAAVDAALHSSRFATIREHLDAASGLLLLQALTGELLADLDAETALDAILDAQLPALLPPREMLAALDDAALVADVDTLAEAGYGGERVLWRLVAAEHAPGGAFAEHSLTVDAAAMFTSLLRAVATADHHVVLHGQGALALLTQVAADIPADGTSSLGQGTMPLNAGLSVREKGVEVAPGRASAASRLALRAFAARGIETTGTDAGDNLHVIVENRADAHAAITLFEKVRAVSHDLADRDVALVLAPADLLVGTLGEGSNLDEARRECFNISQAQRAVSRHRQEQRAGLAPDYTLPLRYVATLPKGMLRATGRRRLALWALAPNTDDTRPAFTTYGDHAHHALDPGECDALAADVAAACSGDRATHAFLRARHRATYNLLDEPSLGLAPAMINELFDVLAELRDDGVTILLVDQMAALALTVADRGYVLESGRIVRSDTAEALAHEVLDGRGDVFAGEDRLARHRVVGEAQLLVDLVAADAGEVVALLLEEQVLEEVLSRLAGRGLARTQLAVDLEQRLVLVGGVVLLQGRHHDLGEPEALADLFVRPAESLQQHGDRLTTLAVDAHADGVALVDVELQPRATARDDLHGVEGLLGGLVDGGVEVDAGAADELRDDDTLGAVDDEAALVGHDREVAHEDGLRLDLTGVVVDEFRGDEQGRRVGHVLVFALLDGGLDLVEVRVGEGKRHRPREVLDRRQFVEDVLQSADGVLFATGDGLGAPLGGADEPLEGIEL